VPRLTGSGSPAGATPTRPRPRSFLSPRSSVTVFYVYVWDEDFGPTFIKVCSYVSIR
jgi:hypothetical protein